MSEHKVVVSVPAVTLDLSSVNDVVFARAAADDFLLAASRFARPSRLPSGQVVASGGGVEFTCGTGELTGFPHASITARPGHAVWALLTAQLARRSGPEADALAQQVKSFQAPTRSM